MQDLIKIYIYMEQPFKNYLNNYKPLINNIFEITLKKN